MQKRSRCKACGRRRSVQNAGAECWYQRFDGSSEQYGTYHREWSPKTFREVEVNGGLRRPGESKTWVKNVTDNLRAFWGWIGEKSNVFGVHSSK